MEIEQKEENKDNLTQDKQIGPESLKVCVRVRPRLKNEFLKEMSAFVDPNV